MVCAYQICYIFISEEALHRIASLLKNIFAEVMGEFFVQDIESDHSQSCRFSKMNEFKRDLWFNNQIIDQDDSVMRLEVALDYLPIAIRLLLRAQIQRWFHRCQTVGSDHRQTCSFNPTDKIIICVSCRLFQPVNSVAQ